MSLVNVVNMVVLDNPTHFTNPLQFEITFECLQELDDDLEWKVLYVGSAESSNHDQVLEEVLVGPVPTGINKFVLQADAPTVSSIPENDLVGVTVVLVTCSYKEQEFARVGYYVNNEYTDPYDEEVGPPKPLDTSKIRREILADKPRVTRFTIDWGKKENTDGQMAGEEQVSQGQISDMIQDEQVNTSQDQIPTGVDEEDDDVMMIEEDGENDDEEEEEDEDNADEIDLELLEEKDQMQTSAQPTPSQAPHPVSPPPAMVAAE